MKYGIIMIFFCSMAVGQVIQVPISLSSTKPDYLNKRKSETNAMQLPFWDDFSFTQEYGFVNDTLWENSRSARVNNGLSIDPPSIFSLTFDGIDSIGKPYNVTDILAKGRADRITSRKIRLDQIPLEERNTVFFSFYYQIQGKGEVPDQDDNFSLWWLDANGVWEKVYEIGKPENFDPAKFIYVILPVTEERFYHDQFQFRFQNFARLSGPFDMWHLDYIYLNKGRAAGERSMPDRTISSTLSAPFSGYYSIPLHHLKDTFSTVGIKPSINLFGLLENNFQPFRYSTYSKLSQRINGITSVKSFSIEENAVPVNPQTGGTEIIEPFKILRLQLQKEFPGEEINFEADSVATEIKFILNSEDDNPLVYLPKYRPINFLRNDTVIQKFTLGKFYARDDGEAEFGAGLNQPGGELGYGFDLLYPTPDTIVAVDLYFPQFGDQSNQSLTLKIWSGGEEGPISQLFQQNIQVVRSANNTFIRYPLSEPVIVFRKFFVGWKQNSSAVLPVGFDKNTDSGNRIYFNITGSWQQNTLLSGSLMIRPVFGKGNGTVINEIEMDKNNFPFPNPSNGIFHLLKGDRIIGIYDVLGRVIDYETELGNDWQRIELMHPTTGNYFIRWVRNESIHQALLLIRKD